MEEQLKQLFYNPSIGLTNFNIFYKKVKEKKIKATYKETKEFYKNQQVNQIYKPTIKKFNKIVAPFNSVGTLQMDLMDINCFCRDIEGYNYIFCVIDIFSRYVWGFAIKLKKPNEIKPYIESVIRDIKAKYPSNILSISCDNGSEFKGNVKKYLESQNIKIYLNDPHSVTAKTKLALVERLNATLWNKIKKYTSATSNLKFIDKLPNFISNYNNTIHRTVKLKPIDIFNDVAIPEKPEEPKTLNYNLQINDIVRVVKKHKTFDKKSFVSNWSESTYKIISVIKDKYKLKIQKEMNCRNHIYLENCKKLIKLIIQQILNQKLIKQIKTINLLDYRVRKI